MENIKSDKIERVLSIYTKLMNGYLVSKVEEAVNFGVNERSVQREIDDIWNYLEADGEKVGCINSVIYDRIGNEAFQYVEPRHKAKFTDTMWDIG